MDKIIYKYFPDLDAKQRQKFAALGSIYQEWNAKINVISRKDIEHFYLRHVLHSLAIAKINKFMPGSTILDVGTGGGFPGIPLAIMFPEIKFHLVDSIAKKMKVVDAVVDTLEIKNVTTQQSRVEDLQNGYDVIVSRAVARMASFYRWTNKQIKPGGKILYLKGGDILDEMNALKKPYKIYALSDIFEEEFFETKKLVEVKN